MYKRLIFTLLWHKGKFSISRNFRLQSVGDINWIYKNLCFEQTVKSIDELAVINVSKDNKFNTDFCRDLSLIASKTSVPLVAGGSIDSYLTVKDYFNNGADRISFGSSFFINPDLIKKVAYEYGKSSILLALDIDSSSKIFSPFNEINGTNLEFINRENYSHLDFVGEIFATSIAKDGTGMGLDINLARKLINLNNNIPFILAGGLGNYKHALEAFNFKEIVAISTSNLFYFTHKSLFNLREKLFENSINMAKWKPFV